MIKFTLYILTALSTVLISSYQFENNTNRNRIELHPNSETKYSENHSYTVTVSTNSDDFYPLGPGFVLIVSNGTYNLSINGVYYNLGNSNPRLTSNIIAQFNIIPSISFPSDTGLNLPYKVDIKTLNKSGNKITLQIDFTKRDYNYNYDKNAHLGRYGIYSNPNQRGPDPDNIITLSLRQGELWIDSTNRLISSGKLENYGYRLYGRCNETADRNCYKISLSPKQDINTIYISYDNSDNIVGRLYYQVY